MKEHEKKAYLIAQGCNAVDKYGVPEPETLAAMQSYSDQQNAELNAALERVKELEGALAESEKVNFDLAAHQCDKWAPEENGHWSCRLQAENERYRKALEDVIIRLEEDKRFNALSIAKEALKS